LRDPAEAGALTATVDGRAAPLRVAPDSIPVDLTAVSVGGWRRYGRHTAILSVVGTDVGLDSIIAWRRGWPGAGWLAACLLAAALAAGTIWARGRRHG